MKFRKYIQITLVLLTTMGMTFANQQEQQPVIDASIMAQMAEQYQDVLESLLKSLIKQAEALDVVWEDLALDVNNKAIQTPNKSQVINDIKAVRSLISKIIDNSFTDLDEITIAQLNKIITCLINHLNDSINTGLTEIVDFPQPTQLTKEDLALENIDNAIKANQQLLEAVQQRAKTAGLTWYNKVTRNIDDYLVQPAKKYHLDKAAVIGGVTGILALNYWFHSEYNNDFLRKYLGWSPKFDAGFNLIDKHHEKHPLELPGKIEHWYLRHTQGYMPLAGLLAPIALSQYNGAFVSIKEAISKRITKAVNFFKGGEYRNRKDGISEIISKVTFDDLVGKEHAKEIARKILKYLEDPERFARKNLVPEKGYLLYGPTRTGKSHFAKALCGEIQRLMMQMGKPADSFGFYEISASMIAELGFERIMYIIKEQAPCVIFIDEIDLLDLQRIGNKNMLGQFLTTLSGFMDSDPKKQVIILAATNKAENLDFALRQHGRFGKSIFFDLPTLEDRIEYITKRFNSLSVDIEKFDIKKFALETNSCTFEDIDAVIKAACAKSKTLGVVLSQELLEESFDEEIRNIITVNDKQLSEKEVNVIATHQGAIAMTHMLLNTDEKVAKVTIQPIVAKLKEESIWKQYYADDNQKQNPIIHGKVFTYRENDTVNIISATDKMTQCKLLLAGSVAEKMLLGSLNGSYNGTNRQHALTILQSIVFDGINPKELPKKQVEELRSKAWAMLEECEKEMGALLESHKDSLVKLIEALKTDKTLTGSQVKELIK